MGDSKNFSSDHHKTANAGLVTILAAVLTLALPLSVQAGAFIGSGDTAPDIILHPTGYTGTGGVLQVGVCIDPASTAIPDMDVPMRNVAFVWNHLEVTTGNVLLGGDNDLAPGEVDWESTILHEVGHCIGLAHPNAATESGLTGSDRNYTKAGDGANNSFDIDAGTDGVIGSADDVRGDDVPLHWYNNGTNNPFTIPAVVDSTTYSRSLGSLPPGDLFAANADRTVSTLYGVTGTEASMQQGAFSDEAQRTLAADDAATVRLGMAGLDEIQGTADDYTLELVYEGVTDACDVVVRLISTGSFAFCSTSSTLISGDHRRLTFASVTTGDPFSWFFTTELLVESSIFADGFESGSTSAWSQTVP